MIVVVIWCWIEFKPGITQSSQTGGSTVFHTLTQGAKHEKCTRSSVHTLHAQKKKVSQEHLNWTGTFCIVYSFLTVMKKPHGWENSLFRRSHPAISNRVITITNSDSPGNSWPLFCTIQTIRVYVTVHELCAFYCCCSWFVFHARPPPTSLILMSNATFYC